MTKPSITEPTAALDRVMRAPFERPPRRSGRIGTIVFISAVGFLSGVAGGLIAISLFIPIPSVFNEVVLRRPRAVARPVPTFPAPALIATSVVDIFAVDAKAGPPTLLPLERRTGRGVALTNDGWVVTVRAALSTPTGMRPLVVTADRTMQSVDRIAFDPISGIAFVHVPGLEASVLPFRQRNGTPIGTALYAPTTDGGLAPFTLQSLVARRADGAPRSSEQWASTLVIAPDVDVPIGTPVIDGEGAMVGVVVGPSRVIAVDAIASALPSLFADGVVKRNALGVIYRDAADFAFGATVFKDGVTLVRDGRTSAVSTTSPLRGKAAEGDTILAVGEDRLTARRPLAELIQEYSLGATVELKVRTGKNERAVPVTFATVVGDSLIVAQSER